MKSILELSDSGFETEVLRADLPVVVDFYAPWCGPCKMLAPLLEQLATKFESRIKFTKANVDDTPEQAATYQVTGVPTLALFRGGERIDVLVGLVTPIALRLWLEGAATITSQTPATSSR